MYAYVVGKHIYNTYVYVLYTVYRKHEKKAKHIFFLFIYIRHSEFPVFISCPLFLELKDPHIHHVVCCG